MPNSLILLDRAFICLERVFTSSVVAVPKSVLENCPIKGRGDLYSLTFEYLLWGLYGVLFELYFPNDGKFQSLNCLFEKEDVQLLNM